MTRKEGRSHGGEENRRALFTRYINMRIVSLYIGIQRYHWQLLSVHFELSVPTQPMMWMMWCVVWRLTTPPGSTSPTLFKQWYTFFYVPQEPDMLSAVRRDLWLFILIREDYRKSNPLKMSLKRQHFLLSYLKTLSVGQPGFNPVTFHSADLCSLNLANQAAVRVIR